MATATTPGLGPGILRPSTSPLSDAIDRWLFVFMAGFFIVVTLTGFIPDSFIVLADVEAGNRPPLPLVLHLHGLLMGAFLLLLLAQTLLAATGRQAYHQRLGVTAVVLVPALVIVGFILVPTIYHQFWGALQAAPPEARPQVQQGLNEADNIMLLQIRVGVLFPVFIAVALLARRRDPGLHKRMMLLATAVALPAAIDRVAWLPNTMPESPLALDAYTLLLVSPLFIWDLVRQRSLPRAYGIWLVLLAPPTILVHALWDTPWWHATAPKLVGL